MTWPEWWPKKVQIQIDNSPAHPIVGRMGAMIDARLVEMNAGGWDIGFENQPANSPDCNTLDLAFFRAIQSLQYQKCAKNINELCAHVLKAFVNLPLDVCKKVWMTAQIVMNKILIHNGNNDYKLPHVGKLKVEKAVGGDIPLSLPCRALIKNNLLNCEYIIQFIGKLIVVLYMVSLSVHPTASSAGGDDTVLCPCIVAAIAIVFVFLVVVNKPMCHCNRDRPFSLAILIATVMPLHRCQKPFSLKGG